MEKQQDDLFVDAQFKLMDGDYDGGIAILDLVIEQDPTAAKAYQARAVAKCKKGNLDQALTDIETAIRCEEGNARYHYHKSGILMQMDALEAALDAVDHAIELDQSYPAAYLMRSKIYEKMGDLDQSNIDLNRAMELKKKEVKCVDW